MLSTCLLSDAFQIEGCLAALDVDAMVCMWTQGNGWKLKGRIGCVRFATHLKTWRMNSISCLVAQLTVMLDKSMPVYFSRPFLFQTFSPTLNQMHVVVFSKSVFHVGNPADIPFSTYILYSVGPQLVPRTLNIKSKSKVSILPSLVTQFARKQNRSTQGHDEPL